MSAATVRSESASRHWLQRLGYFGFAFFLIKGLLWLAGGLVLYWFV